MTILALAIVDKKNQPVLIRSKDGNNSIIQSKLFCALDVVQQKRHVQEAYLGVLLQSSDFKIYGLCSGTHNKVLMMVDATDIRGSEARYILKNIYHAYVDVTANNPFYVYGRPIRSKYLLDKVDELFK